MNYRYHLAFFAKLCSRLLLIILIISIFIKSNACAENSKESPRTCIGAGADFGYYNINHTYADYPQWAPGYGLGGGIVLENMLTNTFGIHSGIWFSQFTLKMKFPEDNGENGSTEDTITEHKAKTDFLTIPFYLITSLSTNFIAFNILSGFNFSYIAKSYMEPGPNSGSPSEDIKKYLGYSQMGIGGGIEILVRMTRFTRFFITGIAEYYFTDLIPEATESSDFLYSFKICSGIMLCTF